MILGIDPGSSKIGWAFTDNRGLLLYSGIWICGMASFAGVVIAKRWSSLEKSFLEGSVDNVSGKDLFPIVIGKGTSSDRFVHLLDPGTVSSLQFVDESFTTLEARRLYWVIHEPGLLRKVFPFLCQLVPRDTDDLAAWAIILRYLKKEPRDRSF